MDKARYKEPHDETYYGMAFYDAAGTDLDKWEKAAKPKKPVTPQVPAIEGMTPLGQPKKQLSPPEEWWDKELTQEGKRQALAAIGNTAFEKQDRMPLWQHMSGDLQRQLRLEREKPAPKKKETNEEIAERTGFPLDLVEKTMGPDANMPQDEFIQRLKTKLVSIFKTDQGLGHVTGTWFDAGLAKGKSEAYISARGITITAPVTSIRSGNPQFTVETGGKVEKPAKAKIVEGVKPVTLDEQAKKDLDDALWRAHGERAEVRGQRDQEGHQR